jgi:hypothetical protein
MRREVCLSYWTVVLLELDFWCSTGVNGHEGIPSYPDDGEQLLDQDFLVTLSHYVLFCDLINGNIVSRMIF